MDKIRITGKGFLGRGLEIYINDVKLEGCTRLVFNAATTELNQLIFEVTTDDVEIDAEAIQELVIRAHEKREPR